METCSKIYIHTKDRNENLIFNGITGELDVVDKKIATLLGCESPDLELLSEDEIKMLKDSFYLLENEKEILDIVYKKYTEYLEGKPTEKDTYVICPTLDCNLVCPYCYEINTCNRNDSLNLDMVDTILEFITQNSVISGRDGHISLFGGEPLLKKNLEINKQILKYVKKHEFTIDITTNGTTLGYIEIYNLLKDNSDLITGMQVSMDGTKNYHDKVKHMADGMGTFDLVILNMLKLLELGININVRMNVSRANIDEIEKLSDYFMESELSYFNNFNYYFAPITNSLNMSDSNLLDEADLAIKLGELNLIDKCELPLLGYLIGALSENSSKRLPAFRRCEANRLNYYVFSPDGYVYPCMELMGEKKYAKFKYYPKTENYGIGSTFTYNNILETERIKCQNCEIVLLCGGGCIKAKDNCCDYCNRQIETIKKYMVYLRKIYKLE